MSCDIDVDVVVPTIGRPTLGRLLASLAAQRSLPHRILLVDDRRSRCGPLIDPASPAGICRRVVVLDGRGVGPAAARNVGWRASEAQWVAFLDDDVLPGPEWMGALAADLADRDPRVAGVEGQIRVPLPTQRSPTDWERHVSGLEHARFATADMAYRRSSLVASGGFDERFRRAYREDAELALRLRRAGWTIERGRREVVHPVGPADPLVSLRLQAGNADDVLMHTLHGPAWRRDAHAPHGRFRRHAAVAGLGSAAAVLSLKHRPGLARIAALGWVACAAELAGARIAPGPRTRREVATMLATSLLMPFCAVAFRAAGWARVGRMRNDGGCWALATRPPGQTAS